MARADAGHAFISYVRDDRGSVDEIEAHLAAAGISTWRDVNELWPGEDWKRQIRDAIEQNAIAFIACFSEASAAREKSFQREEVVVAIEQLRLRDPARPWLIPVRLSDCELPSYDLGGGRRLSDLNWVDVFGPGKSKGMSALVGVVLRILGAAEARPAGSSSPADRVKELLLDPARQIELDEVVTECANAAATAFSDEDQFPMRSEQLNNGPAGIRFLAEQADRYWNRSEDLLNVLLVGVAWGEPRHDNIWRRVVELIGSVRSDRTAYQSSLKSMQTYPLVLVVYAIAIAAVHRNNYGALRAGTVDAQIRVGDGRALAAVARAHPMAPFVHAELVMHAMAYEAAGGSITDELILGLRSGSIGRKFTPMSEVLYHRFRSLTGSLVPGDSDYQSTFDRAELLLGALVIDMELTASDSGAAGQGPTAGRATWRDRGNPHAPDLVLREEITDQGNNWLPLSSGLFGGDLERAINAAKDLVEWLERRRMEMH